MTAQRFTVQHWIPVWGMLFLLLTAVCLALALATSQIDWLLAAALPAALAAVTWNRGCSFEVEFTDQGLAINDPQQTIPWSEIRQVQLGRASYPLDGVIPNRVLRLRVDDRWIRFPGKQFPSPNEMYREIIQRIPLGGTHDVARQLRQFLDEQVATFGEDRVWSFGGVRRIVTRSWRAYLIGFAIFGVGVCWLVYQLNQQDVTVWGPSGGSLIVIGILVVLFTTAVDDMCNRQHIKRPENSSLIVSPKALAMIQGPLSGTLRWEEIRQVSFGRVRNRHGRAGILMLHLDGASLLVFDLYDRPLAQIHQLVLQYWDRSP